MAKVSVGIAVYNGGRFIGRAVESALKQSFQDFEIIIVDDGSTDDTVEIVSGITDERIKLVRNEVNRGVAYTRNRYLELAGSEYLAILDADDEWHPNKLEKQVDYMDTHPRVGVCGTSGDRIVTGKGSRLWSYPASHEEIKVRLIWGSCMIHSSSVFRRKLLIEHGIRYTSNTKLNGVEDYMIFSQLVKHTVLINIPEVLLNYYEHEAQLTNTTQREKMWRAILVAQQYIKEVLGLEMNDATLNVFAKLYNYEYTLTEKEFKAAKEFFEAVYKRNETVQFFNSHLLQKSLAEKWYAACYHSRLPVAKRVQTFYMLDPVLRRGFGAGRLLKFYSKLLVSTVKN